MDDSGRDGTVVAVSTETFVKPKSYYDIPGFFWWLDRKMFAAVLDAQRSDPPGDLVELGTYMGKSTVIIGDHLRPGERLVAIDLFGAEAEVDDKNLRENRASYKTLSLERFEQYYLALHDELPYVVQGFSSQVNEHVGEDQARFVHIDASHLYPHVKADVQSTKRILRPGGLAVFDDYRGEHTPGVSAAVWEAVFNDGLVPVAVTPMKFYGMFGGDPAPYVDAIHKLVRQVDDFWSRDEDILGRNVLRIGHTDRSKSKQKPATATSLTDADVDKIAQRIAKATRPAPSPEATKPAAPRDVPTASLGTGRRFVREVARNWAPPALTRWVLDQRRKAALDAQASTRR